MRLAHTNPAYVSLLSLIFGVCLLPSAAAGDTCAAARMQEGAKRGAKHVVFTQEAGRGLESFDKGNFAESVEWLKQATLTRPDDATAWHFLGLAYEQLGKQKEARGAMEKAVFWRLLRNVPGTSNRRVKPWNELSKEEKAERQREITREHKEALASVESYLRLDPPQEDFWRRQHEALSLYVKGEETPEARKEIFQGNDEAIVKANIFYKAAPSYTDKARRKGISGTVTLRGLLASDGTVKQIIALVILPEGLTEKAIEAMREVRFMPATKDGRPVSQWVTMEFNFNVR